MRTWVHVVHWGTPSGEFRIREGHRGIVHAQPSLMGLGFNHLEDFALDDAFIAEKFDCAYESDDHDANNQDDYPEECKEEPKQEV